MITEDYVNYELAKLLKEKGFDENTHCQYLVSGAHYGEIGEYNITDRSRNPEWFIQAPTLQMAMKWLREVHHLEIYLEHDAIQENNNWWYGIGKYTKGCISIQYESGSDYATYELASETAIKYCLENLI